MLFCLSLNLVFALSKGSVEAFNAKCSHCLFLDLG